MATTTMENGGNEDRVVLFPSIVFQLIFAMADQENEMEKIESRLNSLEIRLSRLEAALSGSEKEKYFSAEEPVKVPETDLIPDII